MTSLLSFMARCGAQFLGLLPESNWVPPTLLSATLHLDTSDLVQSRHKHPALMRQSLAGRTVEGEPTPHCCPPLSHVLDPRLWERVRVHPTSGG